MSFVTPLFFLFAGQLGVAAINLAIVMLYSTALDPRVVGQVGQLLLVQSFLITLVVNPIERFSEKYTFLDRARDYRIINAIAFLLLTASVIPIFYWLALSEIHSILSIIFLFLVVAFSVFVRPFNIQLNRLKNRWEFTLWRILEVFIRLAILYVFLILLEKNSIEWFFSASIFSILVVFFSQLRWSSFKHLYSNLLPRFQNFPSSLFLSEFIGSYLILLVFNFSYWGFFTYLPFHLSLHAGFVESGKFSVAFHGIFIPLLFLFSAIYLFISPYIIDGVHRNINNINLIFLNSGFIALVQVFLYALHELTVFNLIAHWLFGNLSVSEGWILYRVAAASVFFMGSQIPLLLGLAEDFIRQLSALSVCNAIAWSIYTFSSSDGSVQFVSETLILFCFSCFVVGWIGVYVFQSRS